MLNYVNAVALEQPKYTIQGRNVHSLQSCLTLKMQDTVASYYSSHNFKSIIHLSPCHPRLPTTLLPPFLTPPSALLLPAMPPFGIPRRFSWMFLQPQLKLTYASLWNASEKSLVSKSLKTTMERAEDLPLLPFDGTRMLHMPWNSSRDIVLMDSFCIHDGQLPKQTGIRNPRNKREMDQQRENQKRPSDRNKGGCVGIAETNGGQWECCHLLDETAGFANIWRKECLLITSMVPSPASLSQLTLVVISATQFIHLFRLFKIHRLELR